MVKVSTYNVTEVNNYFALFGLSPTFALNAEQLSSSYHSLQRQYHPDLFIFMTKQEQQKAHQYSAFINHAFATLKDPISRVEYLLKLQGIDSQNRQDTLYEPTLLTEQMALYDQLTNANSLAVLVTLLKRITLLRNNCLHKLSDLCMQSLWHVVTCELYRLKFLTKLQRQAEQQKTVFERIKEE